MLQLHEQWDPWDEKRPLEGLICLNASNNATLAINRFGTSNDNGVCLGNRSGGVPVALRPAVLPSRW